MFQNTSIIRRVVFIAVFSLLITAIFTAPIMAAECLGHGDAAGQFMPWDLYASENYKTTLPTAAGSYYLTEDVTLSETWTVPGNVHLCLNGYVIQPAESVTIRLIELPRSRSYQLHIYDCKYGDTSSAKYFKDSVSVPGLWEYVGVSPEESTHTLYGGIITGGSASTGGGVYMSNSGGTFNLHSGNIVGNKADTKGGGVYCYSSDPTTYFILSGGTVAGNMAGTSGGGVCVDGSEAWFHIVGGTIEGNTAGTNGGGVYARYPVLYGTKSVIIHDNTKSDGAADNLYLPSSSYYIRISTDFTTLAENSKIGITVGTTSFPYDIFSRSGYLAQDVFVDIANQQYFFSDNPAYVVDASKPDTNGKSKIYLSESQLDITWILDGGTINPEPSNKVTSGYYIALPTNVVKPDNLFLGWRVNDQADIIRSTYYQINENTKFTAVWQPSEKFIVTIPAAIDITLQPSSEYGTSTGEIKVTELITGEKTLNVYVKSNWQLANGEGHFISYQMNVLEAGETTPIVSSTTATPDTDGFITILETRTQGDTRTLQFTTDNINTITDTGTYTDLLTFKAALVSTT